MRYLPRSRYDANQQREKFQLKHVFTSVKTLPRIARLVWTASPHLTFWAGVFCLGRGILPAISATITQLLFDGVLLGIRQPTNDSDLGTGIRNAVEMVKIP